MKVTIITSSYNAQDTILDTINSIKNQSYKDIEHIIIDGLSTDETLDIVEKHKISNSLVLSERDKGFYDAINKGLGMATGEIIAILNADDMYENNEIIKLVVDTFKNNQSISACYGNLCYVKANNTNVIVRKWKSKDYREGLFFKGWMPAHPTFFVKKEVYQNFGNFRLDIGTAADYELMLRFIHKYKIKVKFIDCFMVKMRAGGMSNSSLTVRLKANRMDRKAWKVNQVTPRFYTLLLKPFSKLIQFINI